MTTLRELVAPTFSERRAADERQAAWHEAGHAVAVWALGGDIVSAMVGGPDLGAVRYRHDDPWAGIRGVVAAAGCAGAALGGARDPARLCAGDAADLARSARAHAATRALDEATARANLEARAWALVREHEPVVAAVAAALLERRHLGRDELLGVIRSAARATAEREAAEALYDRRPVSAARIHPTRTWRSAR